MPWCLDGGWMDRWEGPGATLAPDGQFWMSTAEAQSPKWLGTKDMGLAPSEKHGAA